MSNWQPNSLWDYLKDKIDGEYRWLKENRFHANCYVCYCKGKEVGFIPIEFSGDDIEWNNWWVEAHKRHSEGLSIKDLMEEIVDRHIKWTKS